MTYLIAKFDIGIGPFYFKALITQPQHMFQKKIIIIIIIINQIC